jgi:sirohydrochlorin cobaltochelatase
VKLEPTALLLVGHGTRSDVGKRQFLELTVRVAKNLAPLRVEPAFLELSLPDIEAAIKKLVPAQISRLVTLPLLLFAAGHAKRDIPEAVRAALVRFGLSHVTQIQAAHLGCHPALIALSQRRMNEILADKLPIAASETCLLLVGRGSHDESATAEMHEFARLRQLAQRRMRVEVAFLAMAQPLLQERLVYVTSQNFRRVIVQPHLLFQGELVDAVEEQVAQARDRNPKIEWLVTSPLADAVGNVTPASQILENVILERCEEAGIRVVAARGDD